MKKLGLLFIGILIAILFLIWYMVYKNDSYIETIREKIIKNTEIFNIEYVNMYDDYYIVLNSDSLYLIDNKYNLVLEIERFLIHENDKKYDIIYKDDSFMYFNQIYEDGSIVYEYYDIYKYDLINRVIVGGKYG